MADDSPNDNVTLAYYGPNGHRMERAPSPAEVAAGASQWRELYLEKFNVSERTRLRDGRTTYAVMVAAAGENYELVGEPDGKVYFRGEHRGVFYAHQEIPGVSAALFKSVVLEQLNNTAGSAHMTHLTDLVAAIITPPQQVFYGPKPQDHIPGGLQADLTPDRITGQETFNIFDHGMDLRLDQGKVTLSFAGIRPAPVTDISPAELSGLEQGIVKHGKITADDGRQADALIARAQHPRRT